MSTAGVARHCILFVTGVRSKMPKIILRNDWVHDLCRSGYCRDHVIRHTCWPAYSLCIVVLNPVLRGMCVPNCKIITRGGGGGREVV